MDEASASKSSKHPNVHDGRLVLVSEPSNLNESENRVPATTFPCLRKKVDKLIHESAKYEPQDGQADHAKQSKSLRNIFTKYVWPSLRNDYDQMTQDLRKVLEATLQQKGIHAEVSGRTKDIDSAKTTLERREKHLFDQDKEGFGNLHDIFHEMHDLCGLRIVLHFQDDLEKVETLIGKFFKKRKEPAKFRPDRKVGGSWKVRFGAYETLNHRVALSEANEAIMPQYSGIMFEIQLTTLSEYLYNKLAHDLLYKRSTDVLSSQDEMAIDLSHGLARCFELCMRMLKDKLERNDAKEHVSVPDDLSQLSEHQLNEAQSVVDEFEKTIQLEALRESVTEKMSELITQKLQAHLNERQQMADDRAWLSILRSTCTDPRHDKKRIEHTKGGLLQDSYKWILENDIFQQWREWRDALDDQNRLLWIRGDPGKGKTMLLCGIIDELPPSITFYFFCQATDSRINSASAVLRGLIYLLITQHQSLPSHVRAKYGHIGRQLFEDTNSFVVLSEILELILRDLGPRLTYLVVDGLDECAVDLPDLLDVITDSSAKNPTVKWLVSSRNWPKIQERLGHKGTGLSLRLELNNDSICDAIHQYILHKIDQLARQKEYEGSLKKVVKQYLISHSGSTFLWVALVCQELTQISRWKVNEKTLASLFPRGLTKLYGRMMDEITNSDDAQLCNEILTTISIVYRPVTLDELPSLMELPSCNRKDLEDMIGLCGSFLTLQDQTISFIHQSAKDFLTREKSTEAGSTVQQTQHQFMFSNCIGAMSQHLRQNVYNLPTHGSIFIQKPREFPDDNSGIIRHWPDGKQIILPEPNPLAPIRYACTYWVDHLREAQTASQDIAVGAFLMEHFLHWLEAMSLLNSTSEAVVVISNLVYLLEETLAAESKIFLLVCDMYRFASFCRSIIRKRPLQVYSSALMFSPACSLTRIHFESTTLHWITRKPEVETHWNPCLLEIPAYENRRQRHLRSSNCVAFSPDGRRIASTGLDNTPEFSWSWNDQMSDLKVWNADTGDFVSQLEKPLPLLVGYVSSLAFLSDGRLLCGLSNSAVQIFDITSTRLVACMTLEKPVEEPVHAYNYDRFAVSVACSASGRIATATTTIVKIWDTATAACMMTISPDSKIKSMAFSYDGKHIACGHGDNTITIWNATSGLCTRTLQCNGSGVSVVAFSPEGRLASATENDPDCIIKVWDVTSGTCITQLENWDPEEPPCISSIAFAHDSKHIASVSLNSDKVRIWDVESRACIETLEGHRGGVSSIAFSRNGQRIASTSPDGTIRVWADWDAKSRASETTTLDGHQGAVTSLALSLDGRHMASTSRDSVIVWDTGNGTRISSTSVRVFPDAFHEPGDDYDADQESNSRAKFDFRHSFGAQDIARYVSGGGRITKSSRHAASFHTTVNAQQLSHPSVYSLYPGFKWIAKNGEPLIWLPKGLRPARADNFIAFGRTIFIGCASGRVWSIEFR